MNDILWKSISTFWSEDHVKKAVVSVDKNTHSYFIDFYINEQFAVSKAYPAKSLYWVEDAAENYTKGILYPDNNFDV